MYRIGVDLGGAVLLVRCAVVGVGLVVGSVVAAASHQGEHHDQSQEQAHKSFHSFLPLFSSFESTQY